MVVEAMIVVVVVLYKELFPSVNRPPKHISSESCTSRTLLFAFPDWLLFLPLSALCLFIARGLTLIGLYLVLCPGLLIILVFDLIEWLCSGLLASFYHVVCFKSYIMLGIVILHCDYMYY